MKDAFSGEVYSQAIRQCESMRRSGRVTQIVGLVIESQGPNVNLGDLCYVSSRGGSQAIPAEVVGFRQNRVLLMPIAEMEGIGPGCEVISAQGTLR